MTDAPSYQTEFDALPGMAVTIAPAITRVTAPNASAYTFTGTNSFILGENSVFILDPGPDDPAHFAALEAAIAGRKVKAIILTHTHRDHSALAPRLSQAMQAPLWFGGEHRLSRPLRLFEVNPFARSGHYGLMPDRKLDDGEILEADGILLEAIATPGHCANHFAFSVRGTPYLFSGDHVMGWNSTLVAAPDGALAPYLESLDRLIARSERLYLPGHGGPIENGPAQAKALKAHRLMRNGQILEAIADGSKTLAAISTRMYPHLKGRIGIAARYTVAAHLDYLKALGKLDFLRTPFGTRVWLS